jgi:predicted dithiol-disulfide oxidoreductase (DUF899 family)
MINSQLLNKQEVAMRNHVASREEWLKARLELLAADLVPKGRDEDGLSFPMEWIRRHDRY